MGCFSLLQKVGVLFVAFLLFFISAASQMWMFGSSTSSADAEATKTSESSTPSIATASPSTSVKVAIERSIGSEDSTSPTDHTDNTSEHMETSSLLELATAACQSAVDGPVHLQVRQVLNVDVEGGRYVDFLQDILKDPDFLRRKVPDVSDMSDDEFGRTRDLVCVALSHLQGRIVTANGFCKTGRTNYVTSWRGKCQASGSAGENLAPANRRKTVKCHCNFSFHLNRQGQIFLKGEHTCPETKKNILSSSNKLLSYTLSYSMKNELLQSCVKMLRENSHLKRRDVENHVDRELRAIGILPDEVSSGSFARVLYTKARANCTDYNHNHTISSADSNTAPVSGTRVKDKLVKKKGGRETKKLSSKTLLTPTLASVSASGETSSSTSSSRSTTSALPTEADGVTRTCETVTTSSTTSVRPSELTEPNTSAAVKVGDSPSASRAQSSTAHSATSKTETKQSQSAKSIPTSSTSSSVASGSLATSKSGEKKRGRGGGRRLGGDCDALETVASSADAVTESRVPLKKRKVKKV